MAKSRKRAEEPAGPLNGSPSHLLHRALHIALDVYAEETGPGAVTQRQFAVLAAAAEREGLTQTDLVLATGIDRSTLAELVSRMISKGLLARERSALDARANAVHLTEQGRAALEAVRGQVEAADRRILSLLPKGKRETFVKLLAALATARPEAAAEKPKKAKPAKAPKAERPAKADKPAKTERKKTKKAA